jgi:hypothetical protein
VVTLQGKEELWHPAEECRTGDQMSRVQRHDIIWIDAKHCDQLDFLKRNTQFDDWMDML